MYEENFRASDISLENKHNYLYIIYKNEFLESLNTIKHYLYNNDIYIWSNI